MCSLRRDLILSTLELTTSTVVSTTPEPSQGITNEDQGDRNQLKMIIATFRSDAGVTRGSYSVALPDGRVQTVSYTGNID